MVTVSEAVAITTPVATPIVAPVAPVVTSAIEVPVVTPIADAPLVAPVATPTVVTPVAEVPVVTPLADAPITTPIVDSQVNQTEALTALFSTLFEPIPNGGFLEKSGREQESYGWFSAIWIILTLCVFGAAYDTFGRALMQSVLHKRSSFRFTKSANLSRK